MVFIDKIQVNTSGNTDIIDLTPKLQPIIERSNISNGNVNLFVVGSTAAITTIEYEPGLIADLKKFFEMLVPQNNLYYHEKTWGDGNGHSHIRASILGPSLSLPLINSKPVLGTWQQVILVDFDIRPRRREIVVNIIG